MTTDPRESTATRLADVSAERARNLPPLPVKTLIVSNILPPAASGQSIVLHRLLRGFDPSSYCLASVTDYRDGARLPSQKEFSIGRLDGPYHYLEREKAPFNVPEEGAVWKWPIRRFINQLVRLRARSRAIANIARQEKVEAIIACSGNILDIPAAYWAARMLKLPFYPYMFDDYVAQWTSASQRWLAKACLPTIARRSASVIVPNEFLEERYRQVFGARATVIHNPVEPAPSFSAADKPATQGPIRLVFTGQVYGAHFDAFRTMRQALELVPAPGAQLDVYTGCPHDWLRREGLTGRIHLLDHVELRESMRLQASADIVFLPLAFDSPYPPEVLRTAAPGKLGEYLQCGRPVLVHAPADAFVTWYFRTNDCGVVVDRPDPSLLANAIERVVAEPAWASRLVARARECAARDFQLANARSAFAQTLESRRAA